MGPTAVSTHKVVSLVRTLSWPGSVSFVRALSHPIPTTPHFHPPRTHPPPLSWHGLVRGPCLGKVPKTLPHPPSSTISGGTTKGRGVCRMPRHRLKWAWPRTCMGSRGGQGEGAGPGPASRPSPCHLSAPHTSCAPHPTGVFKSAPWPRTSSPQRKMLMCEEPIRGVPHIEAPQGPPMHAAVF